MKFKDNWVIIINTYVLVVLAKEKQQMVISGDMFNV